MVECQKAIHMKKGNSDNSQRIEGEMQGFESIPENVTTKECLETLEKFYKEKLNPLGDHASQDSVAGVVQITQKEKNAIFWIAYQMREIQNARSKGGKANKKFASDKERYAFHNARRREKKLESK